MRAHLNMTHTIIAGIRVMEQPAEHQEVLTSLGNHGKMMLLKSNNSLKIELSAHFL